VDLAERAGIPFYSLNVNRSILKDRENVFLFLPSIESLMEPLIKESKNRNLKKVFVVSTSQDSCILQAEIFKEKSGSEIVGIDEVAPAETNLGGLAVKIRSKAPDAVFASTIIPQGALLTKKLREVGFKGQIFASMQESSLSELALSNNTLLGAYVVSQDDRKARSFSEAYKKEFAESPSKQSDFAINGYIAFQLILEGLRAGDTQSYLSNLKDFPSALGPISADGHRGFTFPLALKKFTENGFEYLED
jgi:ABC-type branched-subunit amino acid transport system substrate-binding protein